MPPPDLLTQVVPSGNSPLVTSDFDSVARRSARQDALKSHIVEAVVELLIEGVDINHDVVSERSGVGRRTIYRCFPGHDPLIQAAWEQVISAARTDLRTPRTEDQYFTDLSEIYSIFDQVPNLVSLLCSTPRGRDIRRSKSTSTVEAYRSAFGDDVRNLPPEDRVLPLAVLQLLHTVPWLEMRDSWGLDGTQIARACGWAARVLLADLRRRGTLPLEAGAVSDWASRESQDAA